MVLVNCGCGKKYANGWVNLDFISNDSNIQACNLINGLPFESNTVDWIYSSHFIEHLSRKQAVTFLRECHRVIKPNGGIRIVVPDLENICREYLRCLDEVRNLGEERKDKYEYSVIELLDQLTRQERGGEMLRYWRREDVDFAYIKKRNGIEAVSSAKYKPQDTREVVSRYADEMRKTPIKTICYILKKYMSRLINGLFGNTKFLLTYNAGKFSLSGELHRWMYDDYSLSRLFLECGFEDVETKQYNVSAIPEFVTYGLEQDDYGDEYKPNSIYMEASKRC